MPAGDDMAVCAKLFDAFQFEADMLYYGNAFTEQADPATCGAYEMGETLIDVSAGVHGKVVVPSGDLSRRFRFGKSD